MKPKVDFYGWWPKRLEGEIFWAFYILPSIEISYNAYEGAHKSAELSIAWLFFEVVIKVSKNK